jgi:8-oxo-dGTP pyrophosphatase MutT (NUDIX family)
VVECADGTGSTAHDRRLERRSFATFPAAVVVPIVNRREELLLLKSPRRPGLWEPVNGAVDDGESLLEAALREVREEAGRELRVRPLGVVHASSFAYDARVQRMISVVYLMAHEGGAAVPGGDMRASRVRWATLSAIESDGLGLLPPLDQAWLRRRTVELFRLWEPESAAPLQGPLSASDWNKADHAEPDGTASQRGRPSTRGGGP